ncbi:hypothetical protein MKX01_018191 [Papaver californicum]|nr:hypothetical protein MKX01_018191 [Papaver californicum]
MMMFSKRRSGLISKASKLCKLCADIIVCLIIFFSAGKAYTFSNSPMGVCNMVERFLEEQTKDKKQQNKSVHRSKNSTQCRNKAAVGSGNDSFWWDNIEIEELDSMEMLKSVRESLANLKQNLSVRKAKLMAAASSPLIAEDTATTITEKHEAGKICSKDHLNIDLSLNLGWKFHENATTSLLWEAEVARDEAEEDPPFSEKVWS